MNADNQHLENNSAKAVVKKTRKISLVWIIPILAFIITAILIWNNTLNVGPSIKIIMSDAEGMEAGKTLVKFRSVVVGTVSEINLSKDLSKTVLTVKMKPDTDKLLNRKSKFWVVKPRIENTTVTGLETILSGAYIQMLRGEDDSFKDEFVCLDTPPVNTEVGYGKYIYLESADNKKVQVGDPLIYKGFKVGSITYVTLDAEHDLIRYSAYIEEKYKQLIGENSVFWAYNGLNFSLGPTGIDFNFDNLNNILQGGVIFDNIASFKLDNKGSENNKTYTLYRDQKQAKLSVFFQKPNFVVMLDDNLRNIRVGSKVTFKGVGVGEVIAVPWYENDLDIYKSDSKIPVLIAIDAQAVNMDFINDFYISALKNKQLCASMGSSSLITADNEIALIMDKKRCGFDYALYRDVPVISILPSVTMSAQIDSILSKIKAVDFDKLSGEMTKAIISLDGLIHSLDKVVTSIDDQDTVGKLNEVLKRLDEVLFSLNKTTKDYGKDSKIYKNIDKSLEQINSLINEIQPAVEKISKNPSSIIFGSDSSDPEIKVSKK